MGSRTGFWGGLLGYSAPRERFSLEELRHLHDTLIRNSTVTDSNRDLVVETLRSIAELMIWGDQHEPRFFDYFAENNVLQHFTQFLQKRSNRRGDVAVQACPIQQHEQLCFTTYIHVTCIPLRQVYLYCQCTFLAFNTVLFSLLTHDPR